MKTKRLVALGLIAVLGSAQVVTAYADEIQQVQQQKEDANDSLEALTDSISDLEAQKSQIEGEIESLDGQLITTIASVNMPERSDHGAGSSPGADLKRIWQRPPRIGTSSMRP